MFAAPRKKFTTYRRIERGLTDKVHHKVGGQTIPLAFSDFLKTVRTAILPACGGAQPVFSRPFCSTSVAAAGNTYALSASLPRIRLLFCFIDNTP
ncbi:MAG: hypothetical protein JNL32_08630 [Candidatus Kapabacteria bacterium]|nr:hypothetical protein [Candidatus Kapabacteria bacterium]